MLDHEFLLNEFKKALQANARTEVIDLDDKFVHKFDFNINRYENVLKSMGYRMPPIRWSYYRIGFIKRGSGEYINGIHKFNVSENTLFITPPRVITSSKNWSQDTTGYIVLFNLDFFLQNNFPHKLIDDKRILHPSIQPYIHLDDEKAAIIEQIFETILTEKDSTNKNKEELIALKLIELLIVSERLFDEQFHFEENIPSIDIVKRFVDMVEANFLQQRFVGFYAAQLNMHPNYLNSLIKKHTGLTAKESIQNRLLLETKYLLHSTNLTIKEISNQMGFDDPNYFTVFFKRFENTSPANYRLSFV